MQDRIGQVLVVGERQVGHVRERLPELLPLRRILEQPHAHEQIAAGFDREGAQCGQPAQYGGKIALLYFTRTKHDPPDVWPEVGEEVADALEIDLGQVDVREVAEALQQIPYRGAIRVERLAVQHEPEVLEEGGMVRRLAPPAARLAGLAPIRRRKVGEDFDQNLKLKATN